MSPSHHTDDEACSDHFTASSVDPSFVRSDDHTESLRRSSQESHSHYRIINGSSDSQYFVQYCSSNLIVNLQFLVRAAQNGAGPDEDTKIESGGCPLQGIVEGEG